MGEMQAIDMYSEGNDDQEIEVSKDQTYAQEQEQSSAMDCSMDFDTHNSQEEIKENVIEGTKLTAEGYNPETHK
eukprot:CAMPEP_0116871826 /NCGR_PEP_ID=MMETSP0463-20121206/2334_1 /TAXON_ID=181622 /ORGANISM="Strombidinopsis sp, Strain SopsisLIS2011" /LENGTH=73 /DNA_ID=CAMNT_0004510951 /DNA_START=200 /DNA_END=421 /DNA_ORIENTATION=+